MIILNRELKQILDDSMVGVYIADSKRRIVYWNDAAERISGRSREDMIGKNCFESGLDHIDQEGQRLCTSLCPYLKTYQDGKERSEKVFLRHKNGNRVLVQRNSFRSSMRRISWSLFWKSSAKSEVSRLRIRW